jgi:hypothetical protein
MVVYLAVGGVVSVLLGRFVLGGLEGAIVSSLTDADTATTVRSVLDAALADLYAFSRLVVVGGIVVGVVAFIAGRPAWLTSAAARAGGATRQAAAGAGALAGSVAGQAPSTQTTADWARLHQRELRLAGLAVIAFIIAGRRWGSRSRCSRWRSSPCSRSESACWAAGRTTRPTPDGPDAADERADAGSMR